ncbi:XRE family transcriptional regulator [Shewanella algae]|nr:helix-turn-helix transcriptional regulator [Shewanella algae]MBO2550973.1 helix-turn-helix transcriptional regulator [Shewanella algae]
MKTLSDNLRELMKARQMTQRELAERADVSQVTIHKILSGKAKSTSRLVDIAKALGCSVETLVGKGETRTVQSDGEVIGNLSPWTSFTPLTEDEVEVPFFTEVELAAGCGSFATTENPGPKLRFSKSTLRRHGIDPINVVCVKVNGTSMEPVLPTGSTVGIDTQGIKVQDGKMYAINHDGMLRIKLLYRLPGNGLRLRSYNQEEYPDEIYPGEQASKIIVIGKVFWYSVLL